MDHDFKYPECPICLEKFKRPRNIPMTLECGHNICQYCFPRLLHGKLNPTCPLDNIKISLPLINPNVEFMGFIEYVERQVREYKRQLDLKNQAEVLPAISLSAPEFNPFQRMETTVSTTQSQIAPQVQSSQPQIGIQNLQQLQFKLPIVYTIEHKNRLNDETYWAYCIEGYYYQFDIICNKHIEQSYSSNENTLNVMINNISYEINLKDWIMKQIDNGQEFYIKRVNSKRRNCMWGFLSNQQTQYFSLIQSQQLEQVWQSGQDSLILDQLYLDFRHMRAVSIDNIRPLLRDERLELLQSQQVDRSLEYNERQTDRIYWAFERHPDSYFQFANHTCKYIDSQFLSKKKGLIVKLGAKMLMFNLGNFTYTIQNRPGCVYKTKRVNAKRGRGTWQTQNLDGTQTPLSSDISRDIEDAWTNYKTEQVGVVTGGNVYTANLKSLRYTYRGVEQPLIRQL